MASEKDLPRQSEREKSDETLRDSDLASEHQADSDRDAERVEADKAKLQSRSDSDASRDLGRADTGRSGAERQAEGDERLRVERLSIPQALEEVCTPQRIALLIYDMQVGILSQIKNADQITRQVLRVLTAAREAGVRVFFSRHLSLPKELMGVFQYRTAMAWQRLDSPEQVNPWFLRDNPGFQVAPDLTPLPVKVSSTKLRCRLSRARGLTWLCETGLPDHERFALRMRQ